MCVYCGNDTILAAAAAAVGIEFRCAAGGGAQRPRRHAPGATNWLVIDGPAAKRDKTRQVREAEREQDERLDDKQSWPNSASDRLQQLNGES